MPQCHCTQAPLVCTHASHCLQEYLNSVHVPTGYSQASQKECWESTRRITRSYDPNLVRGSRKAISYLAFAQSPTARASHWKQFPKKKKSCKRNTRAKGVQFFWEFPESHFIGLRHAFQEGMFILIEFWSPFSSSRLPTQRFSQITKNLFHLHPILHPYRKLLLILGCEQFVSAEPLHAKIHLSQDSSHPCYFMHNMNAPFKTDWTSPKKFSALLFMLRAVETNAMGSKTCC